MAQDTFNYMDELQRRLDEIMDQPMPEYKPEQTPIQKLRSSDWDYVKGLLNDYLGWRATVNPYPSSIEEAKNPSDDQLMSMAMMAAPIKEIGRGGKLAKELIPGKTHIVPEVQPPWWWETTPATAERGGWSVPEGLNPKGNWRHYSNQLKNTLAEMFEPEKLGQYAPKETFPSTPYTPPTPAGRVGPQEIPLQEVGQAIGVPTRKVPASQMQLGADQYSFSAGTPSKAERVYAKDPRIPDVDEGTRRALEAAGIVDRETAGAASQRYTSRAGTSAAPEQSIWTQDIPLGETISNLLQRALGPNVIGALQEAYGALPSLDNMTKAKLGLLGGLYTSLYARNNPHGELFGNTAYTRPQPESSRPLRPALTPQQIESAQMDQAGGMFRPDAFYAEMRKKRFGY